MTLQVSRSTSYLTLHTQYNVVNTQYGAIEQFPNLLFVFYSAGMGGLGKQPCGWFKIIFQTNDKISTSEDLTSGQELGAALF